MLNEISEEVYVCCEVCKFVCEVLVLDISVVFEIEWEEGV